MQPNECHPMPYCPRAMPPQWHDTDSYHAASVKQWQGNFMLPNKCHAALGQCNLMPCHARAMPPNECLSLMPCHPRAMPLFNECYPIPCHSTRAIPPQGNATSILAHLSTSYTHYTINPSTYHTKYISIAHSYPWPTHIHCYHKFAMGSSNLELRLISSLKLVLIWYLQMQSK